MTRPNRNRTVAAQVDPDLHDHLRWLADDLGVTVSDLLRCGALMVMRTCHGGELPEGLAAPRAVLAERHLLGIDSEVATAGPSPELN